MELNYKYAESTVQPTALEVTVGTVYLRKDITSITRTSEQGDKTTYWTYQEAVLTPQEFNEYTKEKAKIKTSLLTHPYVSLPEQIRA